MFGKVFMKQHQTDFLNVVVIWLYKKKLINQDISKILTGIGGKGLNNKAKEIINIGLTRCLFQNTYLQ